MFHEDMATLNISVQKHQQRADGKYPVSIRITQNRKSAYLKSGFYVSKSQLTPTFELKDKDTARILLNQIHEYENIITKHIGENIFNYSAKDIKEFIEKKLYQPQKIDFIQFSNEHIGELIRNKQTRRANHLKSVINSFMDVFGDSYDINDIKSSTLEKLEKYLRSYRTIYRKKPDGNTLKRHQEPMTNTGIHDYMSDIRYLFNRAKDKYNDEDSGVIAIPNNPFKKYNICPIQQTQGRDIDMETICKISSLELSKTESFAYDLFMLSFFLAGINSIDLYEMPYNALHNGRIEYCRAKTKGRRQDNAFISVKIEPEAEVLINKYLDPSKERLFIFHKKFTRSEGFNRSINVALASISHKLGLQNKITYYTARHSWATIAHNTLKYTTYDVAECLNHVITNLKTTMGYIGRDFSRIDQVNGDMLKLYRRKHE